MYDIGRSKRATRAYGLDDIAIVPSRRTRGTEKVNLDWKIDALTFDFPIMAAPMDSVMSPQTAIEFGQLGGLGVLNLEGLWTRYEDPSALIEELDQIEDQVTATRRMQEIYAEPIKEELITERMNQIRAADVPVVSSLSPKNASQFSGVVEKAGVDFFVIRGTTVSAEHVSDRDDVLDLRKFIYDLDVPVIVGGCATYQTALHLMRTGAMRRAGGIRRRGRPHHPSGAGHRGADGLGHRRRRRGAPRLHGRVRRTVRPCHRRRRGGPVRGHRQGDRLRG